MSAKQNRYPLEPCPLCGEYAYLYLHTQENCISYLREQLDVLRRELREHCNSLEHPYDYDA